ncbi:MAG: class I SAM-dependent methyltransferase [Gammaproteobacteria bacterium]|nr:class I SAM-dependent methyltransferase [Gammaproteobacteria bacterium]
MEHTPQTNKQRPVLAYDVEPANKKFRLRLARYRYQSEALSSLLPKGPSQVLDAGCGRGRLPMYWARWGVKGQTPEFTGFDYLQDKLDRAEGKGYQRLLLQDITETWGFPDASFDVVICEQVLEHLGDKDLQFALSEMNRVLKPGGSALIGTPVFKTIEALFMPLVAPFNRWLHRLKDSNDPGHEQHLTLKQLGRAIEQNGFKVINARGFRVATLPKNLLEDQEWYYNAQQWLGSRFPGWCIEATLTAKKR